MCKSRGLHSEPLSIRPNSTHKILSFLFDEARVNVRAWEKEIVFRRPCEERLLKGKLVMKSVSIDLKSLLIIVVLLLHWNISSAKEQSAQSQKTAANTDTDRFGSYQPNVGFKLVNTDYGDVNFKVFTYVRYLNQKGLDSTYTDSFGKETTLDLRQDILLNKVNIQFLGWFMSPKFRYFLYVWTQNTAQGLGAQVVVGGNLHYIFDKHFTLGGGIDALPGVRCTEGNFPFWLTVDNRLMADEFFRPSYTMGIWAKGEIVPKLDYKIMLGNNLSQLGVDAGQLDDGLNTVSAVLNFFPTTGEFGPNSAMGDFEHHQKIATRLGLHFTRSTEDRQGQPDTEAFENVQIRISDGNTIFLPNLFGAGIQIDKADYQMISFDAGIKYRGLALEGEYYWRWINDFKLTSGSPGALPFDRLWDTGFQLQASAMVLPKLVQLYAVGSTVFGEYGDPWEVRGGVNYHPFKNRTVRCNVEIIHSYGSPVGALSLPYVVGGTGNIIDANVEVNF
jgi:hypothetical protein